MIPSCMSGLMKVKIIPLTINDLNMLSPLTKDPPNNTYLDASLY